MTNPPTVPIHLTRIMANLVVLAMKARNAHWNVTGPDFHTMHAFFEARYDEIESVIDEVAERIRALGSPAPGLLAELLQQATLKERPGSLQPSAKLMEGLLADYETVIAGLRHDLRAINDAEDPATEDLLSGLLAKFEKSAWMIRAHQA